MQFVFDIYSTLPELYLLITIFLILVFGVLISGSITLGYPLLYKVAGWLSIQSLLFTGILVYQFPYANFSVWNFLFMFDYFTFGTKILILSFSVLWIYFSMFYIKHEKINSFEYWIFILLAILAILYIFQVNDLLTFYITVELQSLVFYILASFKRSSEFSTEAGLKYFVLGAFSSAFLIFGMSLLYGFTGLTNFEDLNLFFAGIMLEDSFFFAGIFISLLFIIVALFFKLSVAPFHMWSPDVYEGSPTSVTSFFAIFPKLALLSLFFKIFLFIFYDFFLLWKNFVLICSFLSLIIGSLGALLQKKWKRFIAYSSINHVGFILIGFLLGENFGIISILLYIFIYMITSLAIFAFLIGFRLFVYPQHYQVRYLKDVISLSKVNPILAVSITLILFSMAGIPPLPGFFAKIFILTSGIQSSLYGLAIFIVLVSSISCFYYIRLIQFTYFFNLKKLVVTYPLDKSVSIVLGISIFFLLFFFLDIELFYLPLKRMALSHLT